MLWPALIPANLELTISDRREVRREVTKRIHLVRSFVLRVIVPVSVIEFVVHNWIVFCQYCVNPPTYASVEVAWLAAAVAAVPAWLMFVHGCRVRVHRILPTIMEERGQPICPRCLHLLEGAVGRECPECGHKCR